MFSLTKDAPTSRRAIFSLTAKAAGVGLALAAFGLPTMAPRPTWAATNIEPEEAVASTIKRLFGDRKIQDGAAMMKLEVPAIAENGAVVPAKVETSLPTSGDKYVKKIYFIVDKNRRPMSASFGFGKDAGQAMIGANLRLGGTTPVRAVAEMNDGTLYQVAKEVKVTVGGCGG